MGTDILSGERLHYTGAKPKAKGHSHKDNVLAHLEIKARREELIRTLYALEPKLLGDFFEDETWKEKGAITPGARNIVKNYFNLPEGADHLCEYFQEISRWSILESLTEFYLERQLGDSYEKEEVISLRKEWYKARNRLVERNLGLIGKFVKKMRNRGLKGLAEEDQIQEGYVGLLTEAADKFDPSKGRFSTFVFHRMRNTVGKKTLRTGHKIGTTSLEERVEKGIHPIDLLSNPEAETSQIELQERIRDVMDYLNPTERDIVYRRMWEGESFPEIADHYGFSSRDRSRNIFKKALKKMKKVLKSPGSMEKPFYMTETEQEFVRQYYGIGDDKKPERELLRKYEITQRKGRHIRKRILDRLNLQRCKGNSERKKIEDLLSKAEIVKEPAPEKNEPFYMAEKEQKVVRQFYGIEEKKITEREILAEAGISRRKAKKNPKKSLRYIRS